MKSKQLLICLLCVCLAIPAITVQAETPVPESKGMDWQENDPWPFAVHNGDRSLPQIAVTMDDCYEFEWVEDMLPELGYAITRKNLHQPQDGASRVA